jgi:FkbH-like protein
VSINSIAFVSNTITKPFERFLGDFSISHYPLDTIIDTLYEQVGEDLLIILLDASFFADATQFELFKNALVEFRSNNSAKLIINTVYEEYFDIYAPQKMLQQLALAKLNADIASLQESVSDLAVLDLFSLCAKHGADNLINERNRYLFQTPFTKTGTEIISAELLKLIELFYTPRIKAIAVDADNTLWGGIVGEDGIDGIKIDNNYPGIVYKKFQKYLLELKNSGIILILLSKNDAAAVDEVFAKKQMPLSQNDFVARAVNWNSKAENLSLILEELKLTKTGIIFLDDSNTEIEEMQTRMGIECFKMNPANPLANTETLANITALKALHVSAEDAKKTALYNDEKKRNDLGSAMTSKADFIASLEITISVTCNDENHLERITQLTNKTNQFNLTTKRYELSQIKELMQNAHVYDFSVSDKFGGMGLVGVIIVKNNEIDTFLMSCRVLGRGIEECVLHVITQKHKNLKAAYCKTSKNALVEKFYESNGFKLLREDKCKHYEFEKYADVNEAIKVVDAS